MNLRPFSSQAKLDTEAADWLARRDRGLTPREQDAYLQWLREDERRPAAIARAEATLRRVLQLSKWRHEHSTEPNPKPLARTSNCFKLLDKRTVTFPTGPICAFRIFNNNLPTRNNRIGKDTNITFR